MKKKIIMGVLFFIGLFSLTSCELHKIKEDPFQYEETYGGYLITSYNGNKKEVVIPTTYSDEKIIGIEGAFHNCNTMKKVVIPEGIETIEDSFIGCAGLYEISIPASVEHISYGSFTGCMNLSYISVDSKNTKYDSRNNCEAIIETSTNSIIAGCKYTKIPDSVQSIQKNAFFNCDQLSNIIIPNKVEYIGDSAFFICDQLGNITIPNSVEYIGKAAFFSCENLRSVTFEEGLITISKSAFNGCSSLTSISIPSTVEYLDSTAFLKCNLSTIVVDEKNENYDSRNDCNAIILTKENTLLVGSSSTIIPEGITKISPSAFSQCKGLAFIEIPKSVCSIGSYAFDGCGLKTVTLPEGIKEIEDGIFTKCEKLETIYLPKSVARIGASVLMGTSGVTIVYSGSKAQWDSMEKAYNWNYEAMDLKIEFQE